MDYETFQKEFTGVIKPTDSAWTVNAVVAEYNRPLK